MTRGEEFAMVPGTIRDSSTKTAADDAAVAADTADVVAVDASDAAVGAVDAAAADDGDDDDMAVITDVDKVPDDFDATGIDVSDRSGVANSDVVVVVVVVGLIGVRDADGELLSGGVKWTRLGKV